MIFKIKIKMNSNGERQFKLLIIHTSNILRSNSFKNNNQVCVPKCNTLKYIEIFLREILI